MSDRFIDLDEMRIYGPYAAAKIRSVIFGRVPVFDGALGYLADQIDEKTAALATHLQSARTTDASLRHSIPTKDASLAEGHALLGQFSHYLDSFPPGVVDRKCFFLKDGTVSGIGQGAHNIALALADIVTELEKSDCPVSDRVTWQHRIQAAHDAILGPLQQTSQAHATRHDATPELRSARDAWLDTYYAARSVVDGVLRLVGKRDLLPRVFYDLAVPANAKTVATPSEPATTETGA